MNVNQIFKVFKYIMIYKDDEIIHPWMAMTLPQMRLALHNPPWREVLDFWFIAKEGKPIILSTGMNTIESIFKAVKRDFASFSLSNGDLLPFFLITESSLNCTLSNVVNLCPPLQLQNLLLLIAVPSSVGLESTTDVSFSLQNGQIIN